MAKRMLIDSSHPEETRVVVLSGNRVEDFDFETASRKQLKGNIYLAKITRVEPSLQAAFVDYGGNRHGFLPFSEIHPDYYRIPVSDREALLAEEAALRSEPADEVSDDLEIEEDVQETAAEEAGADSADTEAGEEPAEDAADAAAPALFPLADATEDADSAASDEPTEDSEAAETAPEATEDEALQADGGEAAAEAAAPDGAAAGAVAKNGAGPEEIDAEQSVDTVGGDEAEEAAQRRAKLLRRYKIQEVIKRRQVILVQVTKEERGNKGAALTTYLSLPGRYCVLMPNTNKGGGISRKISNPSDRRRLKKILGELEIPEGIAVIVRTAGSQRTKVEIRRDYEYLLRLWDTIRQSTLQSTAPSLIYEEANLIKRAIRDLYSRDMDEVLVDGEEGYKAAKDFMKSLTPSHARKVQHYKDKEVPLFQRSQVENQLDAMHSNTVQLRSGGYLVLNQTEALVAIDVNSGRATRERHIEETALKTNLEAAEEIGRQLRLRDLAGLIVIDFIDMEDGRRNREVERRLKESLRTDRARIQLGRISPFGLLEMSRQRMRPSLFESSTEVCPHCAGAGRVRTVESLALQVLRRLEEEGLRESDATIVVSVPTQVALYILNRKRDHLIAIEQRHDFRIAIEADDQLATDAFVIERDGVVAERRRTVQDEGREGDGEDGERKRGRRRRSRRRKDEEQPLAAEEQGGAAEAEAEDREPEDRQAAEEQDGDRQRKRKRRGKRGGRNRSRRRGDAGETETVSAAEGSDEAEEAEADTGGEPEAATTDEAPEAAAEGSVADDRTAEAGPEETSQEEKPKRRRSPRQRRGGRRSEAAAEDAGSEETAEAAAETEERPQRGGRRRGTGRSRGTRGGARKSAGTEAPEEGQSDASAAAQPEGPANGASDETPSEPFAPARPEPAQTDLSQADTPPAAIVADDPKVVIEPATPATAAAAGEPAGSAMQPSPEDDDKGDQPKRRGWWNRFI
ncbi:ribonuclease E/G [Pelagibius sp.]|uniref:ribonuclease E/G n=1 Tax=Pelagibius sp. TaxID=1931238 RepID=UPI002633394D|nr:ribonuclease E/G [Pelagibius sp.]